MAVVKASVDLATLSHDAIALALQHYGYLTLPMAPVRSGLHSETVSEAAPAPLAGDEPASTTAAAVVKLHNGYSGCNYRVQAISLHGQPKAEEVRWTKF